MYSQTFNVCGISFPSTGTENIRLFPFGSLPALSPMLISLKMRAFRITLCVAAARMIKRAPCNRIPSPWLPSSTSANCSSSSSKASKTVFNLMRPLPFSAHCPSTNWYSLPRPWKVFSSPSSPVSLTRRGVSFTWCRKRRRDCGHWELKLLTILNFVFAA